MTGSGNDQHGRRPKRTLCAANSLACLLLLTNAPSCANDHSTRSGEAVDDHTASEGSAVDADTTAAGDATLQDEAPGTTSERDASAPGQDQPGVGVRDAGSSGPGQPSDAALPAFPGAEGYGTDTVGGRHGKVYVVTTLEWDGPGSFHEAIMAEEPRTIVFAVSGVINALHVAELSEANSFVTVAGQTSPGGITFTGYTLQNYQNNLHDAVFRFLRFRGSGNADNVSFHTAHHIVIDHCDFSGATDETLDLTHTRDVTIQWSTISNSNPAGQNYGTLLAYSPTTRISYHHNLSAHHGGRCLPHMHWDDAVSEDVVVDFTNNVTYDCAFSVGLYTNTPPTGSDRMGFALVGNTMLVGPNSEVGGSQFAMPSGSSVFARDNVYEGGSVLSPDREVVALDTSPVTMPVQALPAEEAAAQVLDQAGALPHDAMNQRIVREVRAGTGELGRFDDPLTTEGPPAPLDSDLDGMPDVWENQRGLDPAEPSDAIGDDDGDGYTNLEEYLNEVAATLLQ